MAAGTAANSSSSESRPRKPSIAVDLVVGVGNVAPPCVAPQRRRQDGEPLERPVSRPRSATGLPPARSRRLDLAARSRDLRAVREGQGDAVPEHRREVPAGHDADRPRPSTTTVAPSRGRLATSSPGRPRSRRATRGRARPRGRRGHGTSPLSQPTTQPSPAWSGVIPGPSSWPCRGRPASRRRVSRAPRPAGATPGVEHGPTEARRPRRRARRTRRRPRRCSRCRRRRSRPRARRSGPRRSGARRPRRARPWRGPSRAVGPCTARIARVAVVSSPPMASTHPVGVRGVGHDVEALVVDPPDDDVVDHRAVVVEQMRVLGPARADPAEVVGEGRLQPVEGVGTLDPRRCPGGSRRRRPRRCRQARCSATVPVGIGRAASPSRRTRPASRRAPRARRRQRASGAGSSPSPAQAGHRRHGSGDVPAARRGSAFSSRLAKSRW